MLAQNVAPVRDVSGQPHREVEQHGLDLGVVIFYPHVPQDGPDRAARTGQARKAWQVGTSASPAPSKAAPPPPHGNQRDRNAAGRAPGSPQRLRVLVHCRLSAARAMR